MRDLWKKPPPVRVAWVVFTGLSVCLIAAAIYVLVAAFWAVLG